jgi:hypothetical protein
MTSIDNPVRKTLAKSLTVYGPNDGHDAGQQRDTEVEVFRDPTIGYGAFVWFGRTLEPFQVRIELTEAERISLIEALGGRA